VHAIGEAAVFGDRFQRTQRVQGEFHPAMLAKNLNFPIN